MLKGYGGKLFIDGKEIKIKGWRIMACDNDLGRNIKPEPRRLSSSGLLREKARRMRDHAYHLERLADQIEKINVDENDVLFDIINKGV